MDLEALKSQITARQLELIRALDVAQVAGLDGAETMAEWATRVLDLSTEEGKALVRLARSVDPRLEADLAAGHQETPTSPDRNRIAPELQGVVTLNRSTNPATEHAVRVGRDARVGPRAMRSARPGAPPRHRCDPR